MKAFAPLRKTASLSCIKPKDQVKNKRSIDKQAQKVVCKNASPKTSMIRERKAEVSSSLTLVEKLKYQLAMMQRVNQSLQRQNEGLKKEVTYLMQASKSRRPSLAENNTKKLNEENIKNKILGRLTKKRDGVHETDAQSTGICSKLTISKHYQESIAEIYEEYAKKRVVPQLETLYEISKSYFTEYKENYIKLEILFKNAQTKLKPELNSKLEDLLFLFQVPILYRERPKTLRKSLSKQKIKNKTQQNSLENSRTQFDPEFMAPSDTVPMLEQILKTVLKSPKLFKQFQQSKGLRSLLKKLSE